MNAYCLFCQTQKARSIASLLELRGVPRAFSPQIIKRQRVKGKNRDVLFDLLPGYVFVYSQEALEGFRLFSGIDGIIRHLGSEENGYRLTDADLDFALNLYKKNGVVGQITVFKIGDRVRMDDSLFNGCNGRITQIDHRKQRARVDYQFAGMDCFTWIACDLISPSGEEIPRPGEP